MPQFRYKAISATGEALDGRMEAASAEDVIARLQDQGCLPIETSRDDAIGEGAGLASLWRRPDFSSTQLLQFTRQLATLLAAGQPLDRALGILLELPDDERSRRVVERVREAVRGGASLSAALDQQHGLFPRLYINLVRAGEAGGGLDAALSRLADYLERSRELRSRLVNALIYPALLTALVIGSMVFLMLVVVPQFEALFASLNADLAWYTTLVLWLSRALRSGWWLGLIALVLAGLWLRGRWQDQTWRLRLDQFVLGRPLLGSLAARVDTARLARTLGTLLANGVPLLNALGLARNGVANRVLANALDAAAAEVKSGDGLGYALGRQKVFPRLAVQMVQVGEESGELDSMLLKVADTYDLEVRDTLDRLLALLVPAITLLMTVVIGAIILSVLLPIYDLTGSLG